MTLFITCYASLGEKNLLGTKLSRILNESDFFAFQASTLYANNMSKFLLYMQVWPFKQA